MKVATSCLLLSLVLCIVGCGGGGGESEPPPSITQPAHASPTLVLNASNAAEIAAHTIAIVTSLRSLGYQLAHDLDSVSPASPTSQTACSTGGTWTLTYVDVDKSGTRTVGDRIEFAAPGCSIAYFGNGSATATIVAMSGDELVDVRIAIAGGTLPYLQGWAWTPDVRGPLRMTADGQDLWLRSEGDLVFTPPNTAQSFRVYNVGLRLRDDASNSPPAPGVLGGLDIAFDTPTGGFGTLTFDTNGLFAGHAANLAPTPGSLVLGGAGHSTVRIADAKPANPAWFLFTVDANGDGVDDTSWPVSYLNIFNTL